MLKLFLNVTEDEFCIHHRKTKQYFFWLNDPKLNGML